MKLSCSLLLFSFLGACANLPRDQAGTLERIREEGVLRVGIVATATPPQHANRLQMLIDRAATVTDSRVETMAEPTESLLLRLEAGEIDLVAGQFDRSSPWSRRVHLLPPLANIPHGESDLETTVAARNGENAWIVLLEREASAVAAAP